MVYNFQFQQANLNFGFSKEAREQVELGPSVFCSISVQ